jgi:hypothetical protein
MGEIGRKVDFEVDETSVGFPLRTTANPSQPGVSKLLRVHDPVLLHR